jgi:hypothetical protein
MCIEHTGRARLPLHTLCKDILRWIKKNTRLQNLALLPT